MSSMLYILGAQLAREIKKEEFVCRGMLRMTIQDSSKSPGTMDFGDWEAVLGEETLSRRLANIGVRDVDRVVSKLRRTLVEKQSLLTMSAH